MVFGEEFKETGVGRRLFFSIDAAGLGEAAPGIGGGPGGTLGGAGTVAVGILGADDDRCDSGSD